MGPGVRQNIVVDRPVESVDFVASAMEARVLDAPSQGKPLPHIKSLLSLSRRSL